MVRSYSLTCIVLKPSDTQGQLFVGIKQSLCVWHARVTRPVVPQNQYQQQQQILQLAVVLDVLTWATGEPVLVYVKLKSKHCCVRKCQQINS